MGVIPGSWMVDPGCKPADHEELMDVVPVTPASRWMRPTTMMAYLS
jgi:hypothetical protein